MLKAAMHVVYRAKPSATQVPYGCPIILVHAADDVHGDQFAVPALGFRTLSSLRYACSPVATQQVESNPAVLGPP
jgi:hypothetical protein